MIKINYRYLILLLVILGCQQIRPVKDCKTYEEAVDPAPPENEGWSTLKPGLMSSLGSVDVRYPRSSVPELVKENVWNGVAWRGEQLSAQLVLWSKDSIDQVEIEFADFVSKDKNIMPASTALARFVRYVITDEFAEGCGHRKPEDYAASLSPDVLDPLECFDMEPETTRPVWITFSIPGDAVPGLYSSRMTLYSDGKNRDTYTFNVEVTSRVLPPASEWKFHLDLWQNPYAVARVHGIEPWSEEHWEVLLPIMKLLAGAGQKVITATLNKYPWGKQTYDPFESMIVWQKSEDGTWSYDYTVFDNWVSFMINDIGIKSQINCYSMVPWGNELYYFDEKSGKEVKVKAEPGSREYEELWVPFLKDFTTHLEQKGWKELARIAMDERKPSEMQAMLKLLAETSPGMGVALADNHKSYKLYPDQLTDLCVAHGALIEPDDMKYRRERGYISTWYVCCADEFPNVFTFSSPAEGAFIGWYTMAAGFDGFLRWAYNSWVKEPLIDSRFRTWPAGDTYIVYPRARSSIRFERLKEGIQDAEKIRILKEEFENGETEESAKKLNRLNAMLKEFDIVKRPDNPEELFNRGKETLDELSR